MPEAHAALDAPTLARLLGPLVELIRSAHAELAEVRRRLDAPAWSPGVYRAGAVVQHFMGQTFEAAADTALEPGDGVAWKRLGLHGFRFRGLLIDGAEYDVGDLVASKGSMMVQTGERLEWMALRGRPGPPGAPGAAGAPGAPGAAGAPGARGEAGSIVAKFEIEGGLLYAVWNDGRREPMALTAFEGGERE
jgi:hypothetical protein